MKVLVTGGAGYVGSHAAKTLKKKGHTPITLDSLERGHQWAAKFGPFIQGNIKDTDLVKKIIVEHQIEALMHFAAYAYVGESVEKPKMYFDNNVEGSRLLLDAIKGTTLNKFIFSSTCATYGTPEKFPITEEAPQKPINPYGETKLQVEHLLRSRSEELGMKSIALRYFNAAGADPELEIGEHHEPETHLIPLVIAATLNAGAPLKIFGTDYNTPDGTCIRDYVHVSDLAEAHVKALESLQNSSLNFNFYNLGTGKGSSVRDVIQAVEKATNKKTPVLEQPRRAGDPPVLVAAADKAKKELSWSPKFDLQSTVDTAVAWHKKHF